jgi:hypothetical protein
MLAAVLALVLAAAPSHDGGRQAGAATAQGQMDSLLAAAQRAARHWRSHDFQRMVEGAGTVTLSLPGVTPSAPLRPSQAAELLRAFSDGAREVEIEVTIARAVDRDRAYVEVQRTFTPPGSAVAATQTVYLGLRQRGAGFVVAEVRVVP